MSNSHHFYGVSAGKGGIDIDESTLDPDANYWRMGAEGAKLAIEKLLGEDETLTRLSPLWNSSRTWRDICKDTESVLASIRAEAAKTETADQ